MFPIPCLSIRSLVLRVLVSRKVRLEDADALVIATCSVVRSEVALPRPPPYLVTSCNVIITNKQLIGDLTDTWTMADKPSNLAGLATLATTVSPYTAVSPTVLPYNIAMTQCGRLGT